MRRSGCRTGIDCMRWRQPRCPPSRILAASRSPRPKRRFADSCSTSELLDEIAIWPVNFEAVGAGCFRVQRGFSEEVDQAPDIVVAHFLRRLDVDAALRDASAFNYVRRPLLSCMRSRNANGRQQAFDAQAA